METVRGYQRGLPRNNSLLVHNADDSSVPASCHGHGRHAAVHLPHSDGVQRQRHRPGRADSRPRRHSDLEHHPHGGRHGTFTLNVTDTAGAALSQNYTITINPAVTLTPAPLPAGTYGTLYSQTLTATQTGYGGPGHSPPV
jgi:hypothetical protein